MLQADRAMAPPEEASDWRNGVESETAWGFDLKSLQAKEDGDQTQSSKTLQNIIQLDKLSIILIILILIFFKERSYLSLSKAEQNDFSAPSVRSPAAQLFELRDERERFRAAELAGELLLSEKEEEPRAFGNGFGYLEKGKMRAEKSQKDTFGPGREPIMKTAVPIANGRVEDGGTVEGKNCR